MENKNVVIIVVFVLILSVGGNLMLYLRNGTLESYVEEVENNLVDSKHNNSILVQEIKDLNDVVNDLIKDKGYLELINQMIINNMQERRNYSVPYKFVVSEVLQEGDLHQLTEEELIDTSKRYDMIITNYYDENKDPINALKNMNPELKILMYTNIHSVDSSNGETINIFRENDWILKDEQGGEIHEKGWPFNLCVDVGNAEYRDWASSRIANRISQLGFDGVLGDNTNPLLETTYGVSAPAVNPRTGETYTPEDYRGDMISLVQDIKQSMGDGIYIGNGVGHLQGDATLGYWQMLSFIQPLIEAEDGVMMEGFLRWKEENWRSESEWQMNVEALRQLSDDDSTYTLAWLKVYGDLPDGSSWDEVAEFGVTSYLLGVEGANSYFSISGYDYDIFNSSNYSWRDIGFPIEPYHLIEGTSVYERAYTGSIIFVNPSSETAEISLNEAMNTLEGHITDSITLHPHTGVILMRR